MSGTQITRAGALSPWRLAIFSGPAVPISILWVPLIAYMPTFYATEVGLGLSAAGIVFMIARVLDGFFDPLIGALSDATRSVFGRRRIWILLAAPGLIIATIFLCQPPLNVGPVYLLIWICLFYVCWSAIQVPYLSWGSELSSSYDERSRIFAFSQTGTLLGIILGVGLPIALLGAAPTLGATLRVISFTAAILLPVTIPAACYFVREPPRSIKEPGVEWLALFKALRANCPYRRFCAFIIYYYSVINLSNAAIVMFIEYRLKIAGGFLYIVLITYASSLILSPVCLSLSRRFGRHRVLAAGLAINSLNMLAIAALPEKSVFLTFILFAAWGLNPAITWTIPPAIVGDIADYGLAKGQRASEGSYMAGFNLAMKLGTGLGVGIGLPLLEFLGFKAGPAMNHSQTWPLALVAWVIPSGLLLVSIPVLWNFPIDSRKHAQILRITAVRRKRSSDLNLSADLEGQYSRIADSGPFQAGVDRAPF